jgi:hypothetical protein
LELENLEKHGAIQSPYKDLSNTFENPSMSPYVPIEENNSTLIRAGAVADGVSLDKNNVDEVGLLTAKSAKERHQVAYVDNYKRHLSYGLLTNPGNETRLSVDDTKNAMATMPSEEEINNQAQEIVQEIAKLDDAHIKARAFHQMSLESGRGMVPAAMSDATLEGNVYNSFQSDQNTVREATEPNAPESQTVQEMQLEAAQEAQAARSYQAAAIAEQMPVDVEEQPFETPDMHHALARVSTSPQVVHALDAHNVPIAIHNEVAAEMAVPGNLSMSSKCNKLVEEYDMRRAAAAAHPKVYVHTLGVTNSEARRSLEARVAHGGIQSYSSTNQNINDFNVTGINACPSIATMTLSKMIDRSTAQLKPVIMEVAHSKHFGGRTATLIRGDGEPLDRDGQVSHMTIEGDAHRNQIKAQLYSYEPFFHPQTSGQQYVFCILSEGGLHHFQTTQCDPAVTLMIDWVLRNIIMDPMLPPIDVY